MSEKLELFCVERLESRIKNLDGNNLTDIQEKTLLVDFASCFIQFTRLWRKTTLAEEEIETDPLLRGWGWFKKHILPDMVRIIIYGTIAWIIAVNSNLIEHLANK